MIKNAVSKTVYGIYWDYKNAVFPRKSAFKIHLDEIDKTRIGAIEINANCNLNCIMCNTQLSKRKHSPPMDLQVFDKSVRYLKQYNQKYGVPLHTIGEPLINPMLEEYFKILRKHKMKVYMLSTNCMFLADKFDLLAKYRDVIHILRFSIDGASKETYEKLRRPGKFNKLIDNLEYFHKHNAGYRYFKDVRSNSVVCMDVLHELGHHVEFYSKYVDIRKIHLSLLNGVSPDNSYFLNNSLLKKYIKLNRPCHGLNKYSLDILCDGRVSA
jgi:molybdenum cofactor biosynthesis enzyme MoaA